MKIVVLVLIYFFTLNAFTKGKSHREHGAHNHGSGTLSVAFEDDKGRIELKIPSESVVGFEHTAKTDKDKKTQESQLAKVENQIADMVVFDSALKCQITKDKVEIVKNDKEAQHSDTIANFNVFCEKSPVGSKLIFNFQKYFPKIHDLDIQIIAGNVQKSVEAKKSGTSVELKP